MFITLSDACFIVSPKYSHIQLAVVHIQSAYHVSNNDCIRMSCPLSPCSYT